MQWYLLIVNLQFEYANTCTVFSTMDFLKNKSELRKGWFPFLVNYAIDLFFLNLQHLPSSPAAEFITTNYKQTEKSFQWFYHLPSSVPADSGSFISPRLPSKEGPSNCVPWGEYSLILSPEGLQISQDLPLSSWDKAHCSRRTNLFLTHVKNSIHCQIPSYLIPETNSIFIPISHLKGKLLPSWFPPSSSCSSQQNHSHQGMKAC